MEHQGRRGEEGHKGARREWKEERKERVKLRRGGHGQLWLRGTAPCRSTATGPQCRLRLSSPALEVRRPEGFSHRFLVVWGSAPSPGTAWWAGGGHRCALPLSSSSQSLAGRKGQSFPLLPSGLGTPFLGYLLLCSFPSPFLGDIWLRVAMEKTLCPWWQLPHVPLYAITSQHHLQLLPAQCPPCPGAARAGREGSTQKESTAKRKAEIQLWHQGCCSERAWGHEGDSEDVTWAGMG